MPWRKIHINTFIKYVWPFFNIIHEKVNQDLKQVKSEV